ncbi:glutamate receptor 2.8-like protein [Cinnamomum micranthum f. kanehirae]|uniref:Glutamate receptor 2.8-like protein n=1 Tax=Cinnamomum micranthum f. kanehirae TaxID=337451 RepID=A0A3S3NNQ4_9MAGN|nr:glutamate receptor 2.8-like protein [Cinnamomum micranthum f. kanehirae]
MRINSTESLSFMLIDEKLQPNTEDVRTEPGALRSSNYSTNIAQNNSSLGDDLEWFAKSRELRILVPTKDAFHEFVKVDHDPKGNEMTVTGYSVDVFKEVMDKEKLKGNYSRLLVIFWIFGVFVLLTSYTANLKSMITSDNDRLTVLGIEQLILNGDYVGYQKGSFVFHLLKHMGFQEEKLRAYSSNEEYAIALSRGSCNKGVSAIIEEIPYIKVFLAKYGDRYTMAGPTFGPGGFGFLFRRGCTIVPDVSRAVQKFIEGEKMLELEKKWFAFHNQIPQRDMRLSIDGFLGILLITEPISLAALLIFIFTTCKFWKSKRSPSCNRAVEATYIEYFFKRVFIGTTNRNHANEEEKRKSISRLVIDIWIFELLALGTFYNAILQSMLSSDIDGPIVTDIEQLILNGDYVGYREGSFVFDLLKHKGFQEQKLKAYSSTDEYATALSKGTQNNGVSAIIDETPYIKVFLTKYPDQYTMAGPTFGPSGFGFLFKRGGAIVPNFSKALLKFIEGEKMPKLEKKWFGSHHPNPPPKQTPRRLSIHGFLGVILILITVPIAFIELLIFIVFLASF